LQLIDNSPFPALAETNIAHLAECGGTKALATVPHVDLPALFAVLGGTVM